MKRLFALFAVLLLACGGPTAPSTEAPAFAEGDLVALHIGDLIARESPTRPAPPLGELGSYSLVYGVAVHDAAEQGVAGAKVTYRINYRGVGQSYVRSCTTVLREDGSATCGALVIENVLERDRNRSLTFSLVVLSVEKAGAVYDASANHDVTGDSDGTSISLLLR